jgi:hypothetical protein
MHSHVFRSCPYILYISAYRLSTLVDLAALDPCSKATMTSRKFPFLYAMLVSDSEVATLTDLDQARVTLATAYTPNTFITTAARY